MNGAGAEPSPPASGGWSVLQVNRPHAASTRLPPGKVTVIVSEGKELEIRDIRSEGLARHQSGGKR